MLLTTFQLFLIILNLPAISQSTGSPVVQNNYFVSTTALVNNVDQASTQTFSDPDSVINLLQPNSNAGIISNSTGFTGIHDFNFNEPIAQSILNDGDEEYAQLPSAVSENSQDALLYNNTMKYIYDYIRNNKKRQKRYKNKFTDFLELKTQNDSNFREILNGAADLLNNLIVNMSKKQSNGQNKYVRISPQSESRTYEADDKHTPEENIEQIENIILDNNDFDLYDDQTFYDDVTESTGPLTVTVVNKDDKGLQTQTNYYYDKNQSISAQNTKMISTANSTPLPQEKNQDKKYEPGLWIRHYSSEASVFRPKLLASMENDTLRRYGHIFSNKYVNTSEFTKIPSRDKTEGVLRGSTEVSLDSTSSEPKNQSTIDDYYLNLPKLDPKPKYFQIPDSRPLSNGSFADTGAEGKCNEGLIRTVFRSEFCKILDALQILLNCATLKNKCSAKNRLADLSYPKTNAFNSKLNILDLKTQNTSEIEAEEHTVAIRTLMESKPTTRINDNYKDFQLYRNNYTPGGTTIFFMKDPLGGSKKLQNYYTSKVTRHRSTQSPPVDKLNFDYFWGLFKPEFSLRNKISNESYVLNSRRKFLKMEMNESKITTSPLENSIKPSGNRNVRTTPFDQVSYGKYGFWHPGYKLENTSNEQTIEDRNIKSSITVTSTVNFRNRINQSKAPTNVLKIKNEIPSIKENQNDVQYRRILLENISGKQSPQTPMLGAANEDLFTSVTKSELEGYLSGDSKVEPIIGKKAMNILNTDTRSEEFRYKVPKVPNFQGKTLNSKRIENFLRKYNNASLLLQDEGPGVMNPINDSVVVEVVRPTEERLQAQYKAYPNKESHMQRNKFCSYEQFPYTIQRGKSDPLIGYSGGRKKRKKTVQ